MERNYNEVFEIVKNRRGKKIFGIIITVLLLVVGIGYIGSMLLKNIGNNKSDVYVKSKIFYAVSIAKDSIKSNLDAMYSAASMAGASGYVWQNENMYYLLALIYPNEDMAKSVVASNNIEEFDLEILEITIPKVEYSLESLSETDKKYVNEMETYLADMSNILYELTIAVHIDSISAIACASTINNHKGDMMAYSTNLDNILAVNSNDNLTRLKSKLIKLINIMDKMVNELITTTDIDNAMKYNFCEYIFELCNN